MKDQLYTITSQLALRGGGCGGSKVVGGPPGRRTPGRILIPNVEPGAPHGSAWRYCTVGKVRPEGSCDLRVDNGPSMIAFLRPDETLNPDEYFESIRRIEDDADEDAEEVVEPENPRDRRLPVRAGSTLMIEIAEEDGSTGAKLTGQVGTLLRFEKGATLFVLEDGKLADATVVSPPNSDRDNQHTIRIEPSGETRKYDLNEFNHHPRGEDALPDVGKLAEARASYLRNLLERLGQVWGRAQHVNLTCSQPQSWSDAAHGVAMMHWLCVESTHRLEVSLQGRCLAGPMPSSVLET